MNFARYSLWQLQRSAKRFLFTPYFGFRKFANALMLFVQFGIFKNSRIKGYPLKLSFDPSSICQLECPLCPTGQKQTGRTLGKMDLAKYKKVVDEMAPWVYEIDLNNWGEPFLNENIIEMADYAHKKRTRTSINTNLNVAFTEKFAEGLVKSGLDVLYCSIDGITQDVYQKYRKKGALGTVKKNLKLVSGKKRELGSSTPQIMWQFLLMKHNEHQVPELEKFKKEHGIDTLILGNLRSDMGKEIFTKDAKKIEETQGFLPENEDYSRYDYSKKERKLQKKYCHFPWFVTVINWNGSVAPCCSNYYEKNDFGNAFEEGFKKIWNNEKYVNARKVIASRMEIPGVVCSNCIRTGFID